MFVSFCLKKAEFEKGRETVFSKFVGRTSKLLFSRIIRITNDSFSPGYVTCLGDDHSMSGE